MMKFYENHPSIAKIKQKTEETSIRNSFKFSSVNSSQIKLFLKNIDTKKATGADTFPPKFLKLAVDFLAKLLSDSINFSLASEIFLDAAETAAVSPIGKGTYNKNIVTNFRPISVLSTVSKIYELTIKSQLVPHLDKAFPLISQLTV